MWLNESAVRYVFTTRARHVTKRIICYYECSIVASVELTYPSLFSTNIDLKLKFLFRYIDKFMNYKSINLNKLLHKAEYKKSQK